MYFEKDIVRIAKRENNSKRKYLVLNSFQGKHIPVVPSKAFEMFGKLADIIKRIYSQERILMIGFAETATAIGAHIAALTKGLYMQTTRENIENVEYLYFTEDHSHATEQKLVKTDIDKVINSIDQIIFIEDEVTTGNTIMNIINVIKEVYFNNKINFSIASILNGMGDMELIKFENDNINFHYLIKTDHSKYEDIADRYTNDGIYHTSYPKAKVSSFDIKEYNGLINTRRIANAEQYENACSFLAARIIADYGISKDDTILVLGTEEFMYPGLYTANELQKRDYNVCFHATTRSPIMVSSDENYPLHERYELTSMYDESRKIFVYDLKKYDAVFIITDSQNNNLSGYFDLSMALSECGNENIFYIKWQE